MLTKYLSLLTLVVMASAGLLLPIDEPSVKYQKEFEMDVPMSYRNPHASGSSYKRFDLAKRGGKFFSLPLIKRNNVYYTELFIGSRGERVEVKVSLLSADTIILDRYTHCYGKSKRDVQLNRVIPEHHPKRFTEEKNNGKEKDPKEEMPSYLDIRKRDASNCNSWGISKNAMSKTFKLFEPNPLFHAEYQNGFSSEGFWGWDKVGTSKTMVRMTFAVVKTTHLPDGFLGIGTSEVTSINMQNRGQYITFPMALKNVGYIQKMTYSLFFNGDDPENGSILFGAVDHKKYVGKLQTVPMVSQYRRNINSGVTIVLNKIYLENSRQKVVILNEPIAANLDLGGKYSSFPKNVLLALVESMHGVYWSHFSVYAVDCKYRASTGNIVHEFSGIKIKVPIRDLVAKYLDTCYLKAWLHEYENQLPNAYFAKDFLQHVYVNVDLENKEVSMAEAKVTDEEEIEEINTSVPRAVKAERYSSTSLVSSVSKPTVAVFEV